ncbi:MAG: muconolactone Delta-isomerase family protein [Betaproteobacteria bacterium]|nr:muconolactone Delta-isomerase family protein [Betaproteobacteria bacterium]
MLFMLKIAVDLPGDWPKEKLEEIMKTESARSMQLIKEGKLKRIFRIVGQRANFSIWEADSPEELHATLTSLPLNPYMHVSVYPIMKHPATQAWEAAHGAMPPF